MKTQPNERRVPEASIQEKLLRVGVFSEKNPILEEKLIPAKAPVSLGKSAQNTFAFPYGDLPETMEVFQSSRGRYLLRFSPLMKGQIWVKSGKEYSLEECIEQKLAVRQGDHFELLLPLSAKGRLQLNDILILFSFVPAPRRAATPLLVKDLKGSFFSSLDRTFLSFLGLSLLLHGSLAFIAWTRQVPVEAPMFMEETLASLLQQAPSVQPPREAEPVQTTEETKPAAALAPEKAPSVVQKSKTVQASPTTGEPDGKREYALIQALGRQAEGGVMKDLFENNDAEAALQDLLPPQAAKTATNGDENGAKLKPGENINPSGELSDLDQKDVAPDVPTAPAPLAPKKEHKIITQIDTDPCSKPGANCDPEPHPPINIDPLNRARKQIQGCYERELTNNESLGGKLGVAFTLSAAGRVIRIETTSDTLQNENVEGCVKNVIKSLKFPEQDSEVKMDVAFIFEKK